MLESKPVGPAMQDFIGGIYRERGVPMTDPNPMPLFREWIHGRTFRYGAELVSSRGVPAAGEQAKSVELGEALAADPRIAWISITDNPGGNPMLPPDWIAHRLQDRKELIIHLSCKDLNRNGLESSAWRYAAAGWNNILPLTGDYPVVAFGGGAQPVFDLDSVSLIALLHSMNEGLEVPRPNGKTERCVGTDFFIGCTVSPFKRLERELMPQYFKLARKIRCGAEWIIPQLGYDMRKFHEIRLFLDWMEIPAPIIGNVYVLNKTVAGLFHQNKIPGCVVSDRLLQLCRKYAAGPDKGRSFFNELAAKQLAVFKGFGFAAGYLGGIHKAESFFTIIDMAEKFGENDWKEFAREIQYPQPEEFYLFEQDPETGLGDPSRIDREYRASLGRPPRSPETTMGYRLTRRVHTLAFTPGVGLYPMLTRIYSRLERKKGGLTLRALHGIEHLSKQWGFGCKDCGDCFLPETAYLCPHSACSKACRNGPCGGSRNGRCELDDKDCIWVRAYERLKYYRESEQMLNGPALFGNAGLQGTSSWANTYMGRDHSRPGKKQLPREEKGDPKP